jgi:DNA processing protein
MSQVISEVARRHLTWALVDGVGPLTFTHLLNRFGDAERAWGATAGQLADVHRIGVKRADSIARARESVEVESEIETAAAHGVRIICREDSDYPPGLRQIPDAPIVLYVKGEYRDTDAIAVAVVGSRRCTIYGSEQARRFGELLAGVGITVVSGLARGIDSFAHHGAVDAGGRAVAVLGSGLTSIYPPENQALAAKVLEHGAWISELPMQASVRRENFPSRNRIIAGMTLGTLVVEAAERSGALITARLASEYNREVFAVPGRLQEPMSLGTNALIRSGAAKLVSGLDDLLEELGDIGYQLQLRRSEGGGGLFTGESGQPAAPAARSSGPAQLSAAERRVLEAMPPDAVLQDVVMRAAELPPGEVLAALTTLELKGLVKRLPGNLVARHARV